MGKGKKKAPEQPTTKTDMGLFGSTTTGKKGSTFVPTDFQKQYTGMTENAILGSQNALNNREVSGEAVDNLNRQFNLDFQNQLLAPALNNNWLRGSSANDVASIAQQDYNNRRYDLINQEQARQQQLLANALSGYGTMYDIAKGTTGLSNALNQANSQYALDKWKAEQAANKNSLVGQLIGAYGQIGSSLAAAAPMLAMASDIRLKENIKKIDTVDGYNIYKFDFINGDKNQVGVIAQEMLKKCPECVLKGDKYYAVDYSKLPENVQNRIKELRK